tara:strand:- start:46 stop:324 length:279 start_codon:yes stop_codon:yes gene_type:complete
MANITLADYGTVTTAATCIDQNKYGKETTATAFVTPTYSSTARVSSPADTPTNFNITDLTAPTTGSRKSERGLLYGRRPHRGLLFPRGYYNR